MGCFDFIDVKTASVVHAGWERLMQNNYHAVTILENQGLCRKQQLYAIGVIDKLTIWKARAF